MSVGGFIITDRIDNDTSEPSSFVLNARDLDNQPVVPEKNPFKVKVLGPDGARVASNIVDNGNGTYTVTYQAVKIGEHPIQVNTAVKPSKAAQGTDPTKTIAHGPGLETGKVQDNLPTHFTIESRDRDGNKVPRGGDKYSVKVHGPTGDVPATVKDNGDGTYHVEYAPTDAGQHKIEITLRNKPVAKSPYHVDVKEGADHRTSDISHVVFTIQSKTKSGKNLDRGGEPFEASISPAASNWKWSDNKNGTYTGSFGPVEAGSSFSLSVKVNGKDIVGSPTTLNFA
jgi:hypothetical protein